MVVGIVSGDPLVMMVMVKWPSSWATSYRAAGGLHIGPTDYFPSKGRLDRPPIFRMKRGHGRE